MKWAVSPTSKNHVVSDGFIECLYTVVRFTGAWSTWGISRDPKAQTRILASWHCGPPSSALLGSHKSPWQHVERALFRILCPPLPMSSRGVCRYYSTPRGCNRPDCFFQHVEGGAGDRTGTSRGGLHSCGGPRGGASRSAGPRAPNGVCDFYYNKGFCSRGSDCRFQHESPSQSTSPAAGTSLDNIASLLTSAALARIQGPGTGGFFAASVAEMKPSEVSYHLNQFLEDSFRFRFAADVYGFVALVSNASSGNASWVSHLPSDYVIALMPCTVSRGRSSKDT